MPKLYEITANYEKIMAAIFDNDGVVSDHLGATLTETNAEFSEKAMNICYAIKNYEPDAAALKAEGQRLKDRGTAIENKIEGMKK